jgi:poly-gamma-glutamate synthesis protein (capsule biosynthesis protein)
MRLSTCADAGFLRLVEVIRDADASFTHLEATLHDFSEPELYPAAEGGWVWMRGEPFGAEELRWAGFDMVSLASNHTLDYSYGGLFATWKALEAAGIRHAGTGRTLAHARSPAYLETGKARVALISMSSSFPAWARAGEQRRDFAGRPGLNPLRWHYAGDRAAIEQVKSSATALGLWVTEGGGNVIVHPPGIHNSYLRFTLSDDAQLTMVADEEDVEDNLRSIREARRHADVVLVQLHSHEWDPVSNSIAVPAPFIPAFARLAVDSGAGVFVAQGAHAPLRGIEIYRGQPIFYDPGDFLRMGGTVPAQPADFYLRPDYQPEARHPLTTYGEARIAKAAADRPVNPQPAYSPDPGSVLGLCHFSENLEFEELELLPVTSLSKPRSSQGIPIPVTGDEAAAVIQHLQSLSAPFGTDLRLVGDRGQVLARDHIS